MADIIDKETGIVDLDELSNWNGKTALENLQTIMEIKQAKAEFFDRPQKVTISFNIKE